MADDDNPVNSSGKPVNGSTASSDAARLLRQVESTRNKETAESFDYQVKGRQWREKAREAKDEYDDLRQGQINGTSTMEDVIWGANNLGHANNRRQDIAKQYYNSREQSNLVANNQLVNKTASFTSDKSSRSRITEYAGQTSTLGTAINNAAGKSYMEMEQNRTNANTRISELSNQLQNLSTDESFDAKKYQNVAAQLGREESNVATAEKGMSLSKAAGNDPKSIIAQADKNLERARREGIVAEAAAGKSGHTLGSAAAAKAGHNKELDEFKKQLKAGSMGFEEFVKKTKGANDAIEELDDKIAGMKAGGQGGSKFIDGARAFAGIAATGAMAYKTTQVDQDIEATGQKAAFANIANRQYQQAGNAVHGDMSALLEVTEEDEFAKRYADKIGDKSRKAHKALVVAQGIDVAQQTARAWAPAAVSSTTWGDVANSAGSAAVSIGRRVRGTDVGADKLKAHQQAKGLATAINFIPAETMQKYYDVKKAGYEGGVGMGSEGRSKFMDEFTNAENMNKMAEAGMSSGEAMQAAQMGAQAYGTAEHAGTFALRAGRAQQRGIMSRQQYAGATGTLANAGGGSQELESIMSKAVTVGMENAKNINQMANATAALAAGSAGSGFSVSGATEEMISNSVASLEKLGVNKNLRAGAAQKGLAGFADATAQKGTLADLKFRAEASAIYGGIDNDTSMAFAGLTEAEMMTISKGGAKANTLVDGRGLNKSIGMTNGKWNSEEDEARFKKLLDAKRRKGATDATGTRGLSDPELVKVIAGVKAGTIDMSEVSDEHKKAYSVMNDGQMLSAIAGTGARELTPEEKAARKAKESKDVKAMEEQKINQEKYNVDKFKHGEKHVQEKYKNLPGLIAAMEKAAKAGGPAKMEKAVSDAAKKLEIPGRIFNEAAGEFRGGVNAFINHIRSIGVKVAPAQKKGSNIDMVPKPKGGSSQKGANSDISTVEYYKTHESGLIMPEAKPAPAPGAGGGSIGGNGMDPKHGTNDYQRNP